MITSGESPGFVYWNEQFSVMPKQFCGVMPSPSSVRTVSPGIGDPASWKAETLSNANFLEMDGKNVPFL